MCIIQPPDLPDPPPPPPDPVEEVAEGPVSGLKIRKNARRDIGTKAPSLTVPRTKLNIT